MGNRRDYLQSTVDKFLNEFCDDSRTLLLAFSGGPDSLALFYLLLNYCKYHQISLAIAHVDHGWRAESTLEAHSNALLADKHGLPFHLKTLQPDSLSGNLEEACRKERLDFFVSLCAKHHYQAVLLAHHADDLAETVLKHTFEGKALPFLAGLRKESYWHGVKLWRPLIDVSKKDIESWLAARELKGFQDPTNADTRFLRGKCRTRLLPILSKEFGKEVSGSLSRLGKEAMELKEYLDAKIAPYLAKAVESQFGAMVDLSEARPKSIVELKHLVRSFCGKMGFFLSHDNIEKIALFLIEGAADKLFLKENKKICIDRLRLFISCKENEIFPEESALLQPGAQIVYGNWVVSAKVTKSNLTCSDWKSIWMGQAHVFLPFDNYALATPKASFSYPHSQSLSKWWGEHQVPAFMRSWAPLILKGENVEHEFLTGKMKQKVIGDQCLCISLKSL